MTPHPSAPFKTHAQRGFWLTFDNGWVVSVQWGPGCYGTNYDEPFENRDERQFEASEAEVWAWNTVTGENEPDEPMGWQTPDQLAEFIATISGKSRTPVPA